MGLRFIFMLTRNDRTVADARSNSKPRSASASGTSASRISACRSMQLKSLNAAIKAGGASSYLEVVSLDRDSEIVSAKAAVDIGVDVLLGGTRVDDVLPILRGTGIRYFPFAGRISGHPSVLEGTIEEIVQSAKAITARDGVAWPGPAGLPIEGGCARADESRLRGRVQAGVHGRFHRYAAADRRGEGSRCCRLHDRHRRARRQVPGRRAHVPNQLAAIIRDVAALNKHLSPIHKENLEQLRSAACPKRGLPRSRVG